MQVAAVLSHFSRRDQSRLAIRWLRQRAIVATGLIGLADYLFYGQKLGLSLGIFLAVVAIATMALNPIRLHGRRLLYACGVVFLAIIAIVEDLNALSISLGCVSLALFAQVIGDKRQWNWYEWSKPVLLQLLAGPFRLLADWNRGFGMIRKKASNRLSVAFASGWIVPLGLFAVFVGLFASANPLFDELLKSLSIVPFLKIVFSYRFIFWACVLCLIWPFLHVKLRRQSDRSVEQNFSSHFSPDNKALFGAAAIVRSLILFNSLFAFQLWSDAAFLTGGMELPRGITYAAYAQNGAYQLVLTALLAAVFVIIAMRQDGPAEQSRLIKPLVLVWVLQNIILVATSFFRLNMYVALYSLTSMRVAAFIWFGLVAFGLILIIVMIIQKKTLHWLIARNALVLATVLFGCCFMNFDNFVARYNIDHSRMMRDVGPVLDFRHLQSLGKRAIPAMDRLLDDVPSHRRFAWSAELSELSQTREMIAKQHSASIEGWRSWGFQSWRLQRYIEKRAKPVER
jgi:Domain of unknown function (DUF4173)